MVNDANMRLLCLQEAVKVSLPGAPAEKVLETAKLLYQFVKTGK